MIFRSFLEMDGFTEVLSTIKNVDVSSTTHKDTQLIFIRTTNSLNVLEIWNLNAAMMTL
jgi:hypothetical protein